MLGATAACAFWTLIPPKGSAPVALASLLFDPMEPQNIGKTKFRDFSTFSRTLIVFLHAHALYLSLSLSLLTLPTTTTVAASVHKSEA